jgi:predicted  nucleic acid-binding Zn-ribbon protein
MKYTINELTNSKGVSQPVREALLQMQAELEATNRQVEILSDALAESRREVDAMIALARADEREKAKHNEEVLMNALWKACGDDGQTVVETIESQGELK